MSNDHKSFRLDRQARSFRVSDLALRDLPLMALALVVLTVFTLAVGWFVEFLPPNGRWICLGLAVGFYFGVVVGSWCQRPASGAGDFVPPVPPAE